MSGQVSASVCRCHAVTDGDNLSLPLFAYAVWVPPTGAQLSGATGSRGLCHGRALHNDTRVCGRACHRFTQPVTFLQLVWAVALGALVFAEPVDLFSG